jgi:hypothetical protein
MASSKRPLPIYASTSLKAPPPGSVQQNESGSGNENEQNNDDNHNMMIMEIDEIEPTTSTEDSMDSMMITTNVPLVLAPSYQLRIGCRVVIHGLVHAASLNGHLGIVEGYLPDGCRYKIRPLARAAKKLTKSKYVSIQPPHLKMVPPSTFIATLSEDLNQNKKKNSKNDKLPPPKKKRIPLECRATWSDDPNPQDQQLVVQLRYSDCYNKYIKNGTKQQQQQQQQQPASSATTTMIDDDENIFLNAVNTRIDYDEHVSADQWLNGHEVLVLSHKVLYGELYDAMLDYEVLEELEDAHVHVGLNGEVPLSRLTFPYDGCHDGDDDDYDVCHDDEKNRNDNKKKTINNQSDDQNGPEEAPPPNHEAPCTNNDDDDNKSDDQEGGESQSNKRLKGA